MATDILYDGTEFLRFDAPFLPIPHTHGTGCTLSSALAAFLALGHPLPEAVRRAKDYITDAIRRAAPLGHGISPVNHLPGSKNPTDTPDTPIPQ